jgi:5-methylcytosine-specific restriction endonuclease McrA
MALTHCLGCGALTRGGSYCTRCAKGGRNLYRWQKIRATTRVRDGQRCVYCGSTEDLTVDLNPALRSRHQVATVGDCVTACRSCNTSLH